MDLWGMSDKGIIRSQNQDVSQIIYDKKRELIIMVVCDGMGGAKAGHIASGMASEQFVDYVLENIKPELEQKAIAACMTEAVKRANAAIFAKSISDDECTGMGTTLVAAVITGEGAVVVNVGDSRAYHISKDAVTQITRDHSVVEDMVMRGELTRNEAKIHPNKNLITRALGTAPKVEADIFYPEIKEGDYLLLCSDGLSNLLSDEELKKEVLIGPKAETICQRLIEFALSRGAPDNVTVTVLQR